MDNLSAAVIDWTPEGQYQVGDHVRFPEAMIPPGQPRVWKVGAVGPEWGDGYKWETPEGDLPTVIEQPKPPEPSRIIVANSYSRVRH